MTRNIEPVKIKDHEDYILWPDGQVFSLISNKFLALTQQKYSKKQYRKNRVGYIKVSLNNKGFYIHRLLAQAFIPNPDNKPCVNHKDGNKLNNSLDNLEWVTELENQKHAFDTDLKQGVFGKLNFICKECHKEYKTYNCKKEKTNFCSISCGSKYNNKNRTYQNNKVKVTCLYCKEESLRWPGRIRGKTFCNKSCQMNHMNKNYLPTRRDKKRYYTENML